MGAWVPEWYEWFVAADRCHCAPWELLEQPTVWKTWALMAYNAETEAENWHREHPKKTG